MRIRILAVGKSCLTCAMALYVPSALWAQPVCEEFATDPVAQGRFVQETAGTESEFRYNPQTQDLTAKLDVDRSPARYQSKPLPPLTDANDASFSVVFRVTEIDDQITPTAFIGLANATHVEAGGDALSLLLSTANGHLVANAHIDQAELGVSGQTIPLELGAKYLVVGRYTVRRREFTIEVFAVATSTNLVGFSSVMFPEQRSLRLDRVGLQNGGSENDDTDVGSMTVVVDDLCAPANHPHQISIGDASILEGDTGFREGVFTLQMTPGSSQARTVDFYTLDGTASAGSDYRATSGTAVFPPNATTTTVRIPVFGDSLDETDETFFVVLTNAPDATIRVGRAQGTIIDDDEPKLAIEDASPVVEGDPGAAHELVFAVTLSLPSTKTITVNYATANDTALAGTDYVQIAPPKPLVFQPNETRKDIHIGVMPDLIEEATNEFFFVTLSSAVNATIDRAQARGTIIDDDGPRLLLISGASVVEGNDGFTEMVFPAALSRPHTQPVEVRYSAVDGTARVGLDLLAASGLLQFPPGTLTNSIRVQIIGDKVPELDEDFFIQLSDPKNVSLVTNRVPGTIINDDRFPSLSISDAQIIEGTGNNTAAEFVVTLAGYSNQQVTVEYATSDLTATSGLDYEMANGTLVFPPGVTNRAIQVTVIGDFLYESDETFQVTLTNPKLARFERDRAIGTILNDDPLPSIMIDDVTVVEGNAGTTDAIFTLRLSTPSGRPASVTCVTEDGTANAIDDYIQTVKSITFPVGSTRETLSVPVRGDLKRELTENFFVILKDPIGASIGDDRALCTILDTDPVPSVSISDVAAPEKGGSAGFKVTLSNPTIETVVADFTTSNGSAMAGSDYETKSGSVSFAPGATNTVITVRLIDDAIYEGNEVFYLTLTNASQATLGNATAAGTITDDELPPKLIVQDVAVAEGDSGATNAVFVVALTGRTALTVTVDYSTVDGTAKAPGDYANTSGTSTFVPGDTTKAVSVPVMGDTETELNETFFLRLSNAENADLPPRNATATILDDDSVEITIDDASVVEGNSGTTTNMVFTVRLSRPPKQPVTLTATTSDRTATAGKDYQPTTVPLTIPANFTSQTFAVPVIGDDEPENDEQFAVTLSRPVNATFKRSEATGTIIDDDKKFIIVPVGMKVTDESCRPSNGAIDPDETVTVEFTLANAGNIRTPPVKACLLAQGGVKPCLPTQCQNYDILEPKGTQVARSFCFQVAGECGKAFSAILELSTNGIPIGQIEFPLRLGASRGDGTPVCCSQADVAIGASDNPDPVLLGNPFTYSLSVTNLGPTTATGATLSGTLGAGLEILSFIASQGTCTNQTSSILCQFGNLSVGAVATAVVQVIPHADGQIVSTFGVRTASDDPRLENNTTNLVTTVQLPVGISIFDTQIVEGDSGESDAVFILRLNPKMGREVSVDCATEDYTAMAGSDYRGVRTNVTFASGMDRATIRVPILGDRLKETNEQFFVRLGNPVGASLATTRSVATGTIIDDDPEPCLSVGDSSVTVPEGGGVVPANLTVTLSAPSAIAISVDYDSIDGTAVAGTLVIPPGTTNVVLTVPVLVDQSPGQAATICILLSHAQGVGLCKDRGCATVRVEPPPCLTVKPARVTEGNAGVTNMIFELWLSAPTSRTVTVEYRTADGTARAGEDYVGVSGKITFAAGTTNSSVAVSVRSDRQPEPNESIRFLLEHPSGADLCMAEAMGTIEDDDYPAIVVAEGSVLTSEECVPANRAADPQEIATFEFALKNIGFGPTTNLTATLATNSTVIGTPDPQRYGVLSTNGTPVTRPFTFKLNAACGETVLVKLQLSDGEISVGEVSFPITLGADQDGRRVCCSSADLTVDVVDSPDPVVKGELLTYTITVTNRGPSTATDVRLTNLLQGEVEFVSAALSQGSYAFTSNRLSCDLGKMQPISAATVTLVVVPQTVGTNILSALVASAPEYDPNRSNDLDGETTIITPPPGISIDDLQVVEGDESKIVQFTCRLYPASGRVVSVAYSTQDDTAVAGRDYMKTNGFVTFQPGETIATGPVTILGDREDEPVERFFVQLSDPSGGVLSKKNRGVIEIIDNDPPCLSIGDTEVDVGIGRATNFLARVLVTLSSPTEEEVRVDYRTEDGTAARGVDFNEKSGTLIFPPGLTQTNVEIVVSGNTIDELTEQFYVRLFNPRNAEICAAASNAARRGDTGTITITDKPRALLTVSDVTVTEGDVGFTNAIFTLTLDTTNHSAVFVSFATENDTALAGSDYVPVSGTLLIPPGVRSTNITVQVVNDLLREPEPPERFFLVLSNVLNASMAHDRGSGTIIDNDPFPQVTISDVSVKEGDRGTTSAVFVVALTNPSVEAVSLDFSTVDGTAKVGTDYFRTDGTLVFQSGETNKVIEVQIIGDLLFELDEDFVVRLANLDKAAFGKLEGHGVILNDDQPPTVSVNSVTVVEGDSGITTADMEIFLSAASSQTVTARYGTVDGTAKAGADYVADSGELTFPPGTTAAALTVQIIGDHVCESTETFSINVLSVTKAMIGNSGTCTIQDNDCAPCPTAVIISTPQNRTCFRPGFPIPIAAAVSNAENDIERMEFYNGTVQLGVDSTSPFEFTWEGVPVGDYCITAVAVCRQGITRKAAPVCITVSELAGDVAIIQNRANDPEIPMLVDYLYEMGLCAQVFEPSGVTFEMLNPFKLVIYHDLGNPILPEGLVPIFEKLRDTSTAPHSMEDREPHQFGMPFYFIGEHLASAPLSASVRDSWRSLVHLIPTSDKARADGVDVIPVGPDTPIIRARFGWVQDFTYSTLVDATVATVKDTETGTSVLGRVGTAEVLVAVPALGEDETDEPRTFTQNVRVSSEEDAASLLNRKALFQNAVCWLIRCPKCSAVDLSFQDWEVERHIEAEVGEAVLLSVFLQHTGECEGISVVARSVWPGAFTIVDAEAPQGTNDHSGGTVTFNLGHVAKASRTEIKITVTPGAGGTFTNVTTVEMNGPEASLDNNVIRTVFVVSGKPSPLMLAIDRNGSTIDLSGGEPGRGYRIQASNDLVTWHDVAVAIGPTWSTPLNGLQTGSPTVFFYRAVSP